MKRILAALLYPPRFILEPTDDQRRRLHRLYVVLVLVGVVISLSLLLAGVPGVWVFAVGPPLYAVRNYELYAMRRDAVSDNARDGPGPPT